MEAIGLVYLRAYRVVVCVEHGHALSPTSFEGHLRRAHAAKGTELQHVLRELESLTPPPATPSDVPHVPHGLPPVPQLRLHSGYQCVAPACNNESDCISQAYKTVKRHQARCHVDLVNPGRRGRPATSASSDELIREVSFQTFFPAPHSRFFIVHPVPAAPPPIPTVVAPLDPATTTQLASLAEAANRASEEQFGSLPQAVVQAQIVPWLTSTGIANYLGQADKEALLATVGPPDNGEFRVLCLNQLSLTERLDIQSPCWNWWARRSPRTCWPPVVGARLARQARD
jgi:hypothetical protein